MFYKFLLVIIFITLFWGETMGVEIKLEKPSLKGKLSVEEAIKDRQTIRSFKDKALSISQLSQLAWAAYGITHKGFYKTVPSAGALYPSDIFFIIGKGGVKGIEPGVYHYIPEGHLLKLILSRDKREIVARASLSQMWMMEAPIMILITVEYRRVTRKYGERGIRYAHIEAGHIGQNIFLQAESLGLSCGIVGAFYDDKIKEVLNLPKNFEPLIIMPVGYKK